MDDSLIKERVKQERKKNGLLKTKFQNLSLFHFFFRSNLHFFLTVLFFSSAPFLSPNYFLKLILKKVKCIRPVSVKQQRERERVAYTSHPPPPPPLPLHKRPRITFFADSTSIHFISLTHSSFRFSFSL